MHADIPFPSRVWSPPPGKVSLFLQLSFGPPISKRHGRRAPNFPLQLRRARRPSFLAESVSSATPLPGSFPARRSDSRPPAPPPLPHTSSHGTVDQIAPPSANFLPPLAATRVRRGATGVHRVSDSCACTTGVHHLQHVKGTALEGYEGGAGCRLTCCTPS